MSPELWKNKPYNDKSDVWAMGCLLYEMAELKPPFDGANMKGLARKVMKGNYHPISGSEPSPLPPPPSTPAPAPDNAPGVKISSD